AVWPNRVGGRARWRARRDPRGPVRPGRVPNVYDSISMRRSRRTPMSWIATVTPEQADAELAPIYARIAAQSRSGQVSNLWRAWGGDASGLGTLYAHYHAIMREPAPLTPAQAEMIAVVVSATNGCGY